ncbi:unnamed protein product [Cylicocyclus nassatus]|uniref:Uncharacterized protein n=1 Tax=Cylicocyclus nassatus TaxID=53992 RepID=A0AA36GN22_CYLNA|nr:unnamed protein product [Cylicocyclus nassatus]
MIILDALDLGSEELQGYRLDAIKSSQNILGQIRGRARKEIRLSAEAKNRLFLKSGSASQKHSKTLLSFAPRETCANKGLLS